MSATIVDGKMIAEAILDKVRTRAQHVVASGKRPPTLAVVFVGEHKPSAMYVKRKGEAAARVGIEFIVERFAADAGEDHIIATIRELQDVRDVSGVIVQMPLPEGLDAQKILHEVRMEHDVDVLTEVHVGALALGHELWLPPTPGSVMEILSHYKVDLTGKHVVLVGRGDLVGKPLALMLTREKVTVTMCGRASRPLKLYTKQADIVVTAAGRANTITGSMLKEGVVVIDAGVDFVGGKMVGDIDFESVRQVAGLVTPTPGGVGPVTVAVLLQNTVTAAGLAKI